MPSFDSPIGGKKFSGPSLKEFDIPDEGDDQESFNEQQLNARRRGVPALDPNAIRDFQNRVQAYERDPMEIEREIRAAKEARRTGKERLNEGARKRIEILVGMTRSTHQFEIEGNLFVLQTLRSKEMRDAIIAAAAFDGTVQGPFEIRRQLLARSLVQVAGVDIAQFVGSDLLEDKLDLIDNLDHAMLNRLYDEYTNMVIESRNKYALKTEEDAKEVVEDLKK